MCPTYATKFFYASSSLRDGEQAAHARDHLRPDVRLGIDEQEVTGFWQDRRVDRIASPSGGGFVGWGLDREHLSGKKLLTNAQRQELNGGCVVVSRRLLVG